ncbi:MAG: IS110 family transposase [Staphylococcus sp.]|nr:IS110 family transposase [Staphylococcus sp.]
MILIGIDIGKNSHTFCIFNQTTGQEILAPTNIKNNKTGFDFLLSKIKDYKKEDLLFGMEDTGHYHFALLKALLSKNYTVALINPVATDLTRKMQGGISKNDNLDSYTICDVISSNSRKKPYRITKINKFDLFEQRELTRHHHNLKEELNVYTNRLQKCIDIVFPEFNSLFTSKYGIVYMDILKNFGSAANIARTDIRTLENYFNYKGRGKRISLTADELKASAKTSIGIDSISEVIQIKHLISQIELINVQLEEIDKKIEEFSRQTNSPILTIPGISHFSCTSILSEFGDISNYSSAKKLIKFAGVAPYEHQSSLYKAEHTSITKKGSKYLRKTLYQIIMPVIWNNEVFKQYYQFKISQGKSHLCALGHCVRKLLRVIYHLCTTENGKFDASLLK